MPEFLSAADRSLAALILGAAMLQASVGHGGASGWPAAMVLFFASAETRAGSGIAAAFILANSVDGLKMLLA